MREEKRVDPHDNIVVEDRHKRKYMPVPQPAEKASWILLLAHLNKEFPPSILKKKGELEVEIGTGAGHPIVYLRVGDEENHNHVQEEHIAVRENVETSKLIGSIQFLNFSLFEDSDSQKMEKSTRVRGILQLINRLVHHVEEKKVCNQPQQEEARLPVKKGCESNLPVLPLHVRIDTWPGPGAPLRNVLVRDHPTLAVKLVRVSCSDKNDGNDSN